MSRSKFAPMEAYTLKEICAKINAHEPIGCRQICRILNTIDMRTQSGKVYTSQNVDKTIKSVLNKLRKWHKAEKANVQ